MSELVLVPCPICGSRTTHERGEHSIMEDGAYEHAVTAYTCTYCGGMFWLKPEPPPEDDIYGGDMSLDYGEL